MKEPLASLESSVVTLFCKPEMTVGITRLPKFSGGDGILSGRAQVASFNRQRQGKRDYCNGQQRPNSNQHSLNHRVLWHWLIDYGVPRHGSGGQRVSREVLSLVNRSFT